MRTIPIVTCGEYSDYRVVAAFESEEEAKRWIVEQNNPDRPKEDWEHRSYDYELSSLVVYEKGETPQPVETWCAQVCLMDDRTIQDERVWNYTNWDFDETTPIPQKRPIVEYFRSPGTKHGGGMLRIKGRDKIGVLKVLTDRKAAFLSGSWDPARNLPVKE